MRCERCAIALDENDPDPEVIYTVDDAGSEGIGFLCHACWPMWERIVASQGIDGDDEIWPLSPAALERNNKNLRAAIVRHDQVAAGELP
jgi:hypothetical protein